jgi:hypothetical protein
MNPDERDFIISFHDEIKEDIERFHARRKYLWASSDTKHLEAYLIDMLAMLKDFRGDIPNADYTDEDEREYDERMREKQEYMWNRI